MLELESSCKALSPCSKPRQGGSFTAACHGAKAQPFSFVPS